MKLMTALKMLRTKRLLRNRLIVVWLFILRVRYKRVPFKAMVAKDIISKNQFIVMYWRAPSTEWTTTSNIIRTPNTLDSWPKLWRSRVTVATRSCYNIWIIPHKIPYLQGMMLIRKYWYLSHTRLFKFYDIPVHSLIRIYNKVMLTYQACAKHWRTYGGLALPGLGKCRLCDELRSYQHRISRFVWGPKDVPF